MVEEIAARLQRVKDRISDAEKKYGRDPGSVKLLAVSKVFPAEAVKQVAIQGQHDFGENYLQEALEKIEALKALSLQWHFIGPLQSNKTRPVAESFGWVHSVDRVKLAQRLSDQRPEGMAPINICLQVNISGEQSKSGITPEALPALAGQIQGMAGVRLRGLMALPAPSDDFDEQRAVFARVRALYEALKEQGYPLDTLSMGMSGDLEAAIAEGSTIVRVGSAIFGERKKKK